NDFSSAIHYLMKAKEQGEHTGLPQNRYRWRVAMARIRQTEGDLNGAITLLEEAENLYMTDFSPNVRPVAAIKARLYTEQGRLEEALAWARAEKLSAANQPGYMDEYAYITLARILL